MSEPVSQYGIAQYNPGQYNILVPTQDVQQLGPWHKLAVSVVRINPDPLAGEVFKVGSRKNNGKDEDLFMPTKPAVMSLANAAGIVWNWRDSLPLAITPSSVVYRAVGAIRRPDGSWQPIMATKEIDLSVIEDELRQQFTAKANSPDGAGYEASKNFKGQWQKVKVKVNGEEQERNCFILADEEKPRFIEASVQANMIQWRKNKLMRAETGAMLRVIRMALAMKTAYTRDELSKPFAVPRVDFSPDYRDPEVRHALIDNGYQGMAKLYGSSAPAGSALAGGDAFAGSHPALVAGSDENGEGQFDCIDIIGGEGTVAPQLQQPISNASVQPQARPAGDALPASAAKLFPEAGADLVAACSKCGVGVKENVRAYSQDRFGKVLCFSCQNGGGQS